MSIGKQIFYNNLKKGNRVEVKIYERDIKPYYEIEQRKKLLLIVRFCNLLHKLKMKLWQ